MQGPRKIPTIIGIILVILLMTGISFLFQFLSKTQTRASTSIEPQQVTVTNITDASFTVIWTTEEEASGTVLAVDTNGKKYSGFDERDASGKLGKYVTHSVSIRSLTPATPFSFTILSNGKKYPTDKKNYQVTTFASLIETPPNIDPAYGKVTLSDTTPAEGAIVFLTLTDSQTLSTLVRNSGSWIIPLSTIRTIDGSSYVPTSDRYTETLVIQKGTTESKVLTDTLNDSPVPDIILGQQFDFRNRDAKKPVSSTLAASNAASPQSNTTKTAVLGATTGTISLTAPMEGATVSTFRPQIKGTGVAGKKVTISLGLTNPTTGTTTVGKDGLWKYTSTKSLSPGKQRVTISSVDAKNKPIVITHTFIVMKSGTQVLGDATASAELETPTPTPEEVATEGAELASEPMPTSGSYIPTILLLILGTALFIGGGSFLFIK
ncbi:MAG: hypothetical protein WAV51_04090 [Microgenomates group bacterium]